MRKDAKDRRDRIITAAGKVFSQQGYAVALDVIAAEAGVGRATLYRNFADRCDLALAVFDRYVDEVAAIADELQDRPDAFLVMLRKMCEGRTDHGMLMSAVIARDGDHGRQAIAVPRARLEGVCAVPIARAKRAGLIRPDFDMSEIHRLTLMLAAGATEWEKGGNETEFVRALDLLLQGLAPRNSAGDKEVINIIVDESQNKRSNLSGNERTVA